jgi:hypothetical protein
MQLVILFVVGLGLMAGSPARAENVFKDPSVLRRARRQAKEIANSPKASHNELTVNGQPSLSWHNGQFGESATHRSLDVAVDGSRVSTFTSRGGQKWLSLTRDDARQGEHIFKMSQRNTALKQLGFLPGEEITITRTMEEGRVRVTASTLRKNPDKGQRDRPYVTYERELPAN